MSEGMSVSLRMNTKYFMSQLVQRGHGQKNKVSGGIQRDQFQPGDWS